MTTTICRDAALHFNIGGSVSVSLLTKSGQHVSVNLKNTTSALLTGELQEIGFSCPAFAAMPAQP